MKLPYRNRAIIQDEKLTGYLLDLSHPEGGPKARVFRHWGFDETNIDEFKKQIINVIQRRKVVSYYLSSFGRKYVVDGDIRTPNGTSKSIKTVWIIEILKRRPRFITAFPL